MSGPERRGAEEPRPSGGGADGAGGPGPDDGASSDGPGSGSGDDDVRVERFELARDAGQRVDKWLAARLEVSRSRIQDLIADGHVTVGGRVPQKSDEPAAGDVVEVEIRPRPEPSLEPQDLPVRIVHEDDDLVVVDKPSGMVVHPAPGHPDGTLVNALMARVDRLSPVGGDTRPGIVHRLDKGTSGLLVVAKTEAAHRELARALSEREVGRGYLAAAWGRMDDDVLTVDRPVGRHPGDRTKQAVVEGGKRAVTHLKRLESWVSAELWAVKLETGRTHQIRVHLRDLGHPVVGDPTYAPDWEEGFVGAGGPGGRWAEELARRCGRLFLHAARLTFRHPRTGEEMAFTAPLPEPLDDVVEWARESSRRPRP